MANYKILKQKAMKKKEASKYFIFCMGDKEMPKNVSLYKRGYREIYGTDLPEGHLENKVK
jgi:hypothetical protein